MAEEKAKRTVSPGMKKWQDHLAKTRKANPKMSLKEAMMEAKKSYVK